MSNLAKAFKKEPRKFSNSSDWLKLEVGSHTLRLCPRWNDETVSIDGEEYSLPFRSAEQHPLFRVGDKQYMPQCYDFVLNDEKLAKKAYLAEKITKEDYERWEATGCPMCVIADALIKNRDKKDKDDVDFRKFMSKKSYYYNVVKRPDNKVYMWSKSQQFFDQIENALAVYPDLFDIKKGHDFHITAKGEKMDREYSSPMFFPNAKPLDLAKGEKLHDLDDAVINGVRTYDEMLEMIQQNHTPVVKRSGVDLNMFVNFKKKSATAKTKTKKK